MGSKVRNRTPNKMRRRCRSGATPLLPREEHHPAAAPPRRKTCCSCRFLCNRWRRRPRTHQLGPPCGRLRVAQTSPLRSRRHPCFPRSPPRPATAPPCFPRARSWFSRQANPQPPIQGMPTRREPCFSRHSRPPNGQLLRICRQPIPRRIEPLETVSRQHRSTASLLLRARLRQFPPSCRCRAPAKIPRPARPQPTRLPRERPCSCALKTGPSFLQGCKPGMAGKTPLPAWPGPVSRPEQLLAQK